MNIIRFKNNIVIAIILCLILSIGAGCATKGKTGALTGAGVGALVGGIAAGSGSEWAGALIGAGVGAGLGYVIGNEQDKKDAQKRQQATEAELRPLSGTTWQVVKALPKPDKAYKSYIAYFRPDGMVVTTKTFEDGRVERDTERYRIVGDTLIINKQDYIINAPFKIDGRQLFMDTGKRSVVLQRVDM